MRFSIFILVLLVSTASFGQKVLQKDWSAEGVERIVVRSNDVFTIQVTASKSKKIRAYTRVEGETYEDVVLEIQRNSESIRIETAYAPHFVKKDDKLAAHKVLAVDMILEVPEGLILELESSIASVTVSGNYKQLLVTLEDGGCDLINYLGDATLRTRNGHINAAVQAGVSGNAVSKYGTVDNTLLTGGGYYIEAESIGGNISLKRTE